MNTDYTKLSAYIDGELSPEEVQELQAMLDGDQELASELEALEAADLVAKSDFDQMLDEPASPDLIAQIEVTDLTEPSVPIAANSNFTWQSIAAAFVFMAFGGIAGYVINDQTRPDVQIASSGNWLHQVASYHGIYAKEKRHLVEVAADESAHIQKWLGNTTNVQFEIPELSSSGFEFKGARLLVVKSQPVAQLMYTNDKGNVIAICFKQDTKGNIGSSSFAENRINNLNIVSWSDRAANFLVIGDVDQTELKDIADTAKLSI